MLHGCMTRARVYFDKVRTCDAQILLFGHGGVFNFASSDTEMVGSSEVRFQEIFVREI